MGPTEAWSKNVAVAPVGTVPFAVNCIVPLNPNVDPSYVKPLSALTEEADPEAVITLLSALLLIVIGLPFDVEDPIVQ